MIRAACVVAMVMLLGVLAACEDRPPIDVYGHKDSLYQRLVVGMPF